MRFLQNKASWPRLTWTVLAVFVPAAALGLLLLVWNVSEHGAEQRAPAAQADAIMMLQRKIDSGEVKLGYGGDLGYLNSLLENLDIPVSSQTLVFSKSNFQLHLVSPERPRAIYFNDDVYVGWVRGGSDIELTAVHPKLGPVFYTIRQDNESQPNFERQSSNCLVCHDSSRDGVNPIPRLLMLSVLSDPAGSALKAASLITNDRSLFRERWGGWYVTGTHGSQRHLGNSVVQAPASAISSMKEYIPRMNLDPGANVTDLTRRIDTSVYLTPHSDIVALMILGHQTHVHNLITRAVFEVEAAPSEKQLEVIKEEGELIVRSMLFAGAVPFTDPIKGTSDFAAGFAGRGPRDSRGRSLRDLDLQRQLLRYPLSYLVYSQSFDAMPVPLKDYVSGRIRDVLNGKDASADFSHLSEAARKDIIDILRETKPGLLD